MRRVLYRVRARSASAWLGACVLVGALFVTARVLAEPNGGNGVRITASGYLAPSATPTDLPVGNSVYTIEAWIRPTAMGAFGIVGWGNYGSIDQVNALRLDPGGIHHYWWGDDLGAPVGNLTGTFHHVAATFDGASRRIYLDGQQVAINTPLGTHAVPSGINFAIGKTVGTEYFEGDITEVRIWNVARDATQILTNMNATLTGAEWGLVALYRMEEGSGTTAADEAGTTFDVDFVGTPAPTWVVPGILSASPSSVALDDTPMGTTSAVEQITVTNVGDGTLVLGAPSISGTDQDMFDIDSTTCGATLANSASCTIDVTFSPTADAEGARTASLDIASDGGSASIPLSGQELAGVLTLSATSLVFPVTLNGSTSAAQSFLFSNTGSWDVVVSEIILAGRDSSMFSVAKGTCSSLTPTLTAGASCELSLTFAPTSPAPSPKGTDLRITSDRGVGQAALIGPTIVNQSIPTLSEWGMIALFAMLAITMAVTMRKRTRA